MPSSSSSSPSSIATNGTTAKGSGSRQLGSLLSSAHPFLSGDLARVHRRLPELASVLRARGAGLCWHKHGSFLSHLLDIHRALSLWCLPDAVSLCGLFHSAYSNSYVNLAIFDASTSRDYVRSLIGEDAERLVNLFCVVPRQPLVHDDLLFRYPDDEELRTHLSHSEASLRILREKGKSDPSEPWREKLNSIVPPGGVVVKHIKTEEDVRVSRRVVAAFLVMTMADFADQLFGWQDELFENNDGRLEFKGCQINALWPGNGKPGLWMSSISRMGAIYSLIAREEEIYQHERRQSGVPCADDASQNRDEDIDLVIPPVFEGCTRILDPEDQISARDLYWEAVCDGGLEKAEGLLRGCISKNPFVGEPHLVLSQAHLIQGKFEDAEAEAEKGLRLVLEWGSSWDKRIAWEGWVAWGRVLLLKAQEKHWPNNGWGILNLGLVK